MIDTRQDLPPSGDGQRLHDPAGCPPVPAAPWYRAGLAVVILGSAVMAADPASSPPVASDLRWHLEGTDGIAWEVADDRRLPHVDRIEMTGFQTAVIVRYEADAQGILKFEMNAVWPNLHTIVNKTNGYIFRRFRMGDLPRLAVEGRPIGAERLTRVVIDGVLTLQTRTPDGLQISRTIFPSREKGAIIINATVTNTATKPLIFSIAPSTGSAERTTIGPKKPQAAPLPLAITSTGFTEDVDTAAAGFGIHRLEVRVDASGERTLASGASCRFTTTFTGRRITDPEMQVDGGQEEAARRAFVQDIASRLILETPDAIFNRMFQLSKTRTAEAIFKTKGGLMHSPGGDRYNGAVWTNDQGESTAAFIPFLGYGIANDTFLNIFRLYARHLNPEYRHLHFSIIQGGDGLSGGTDRGDMAMLAYGASWFALARGDRAIAEELFPFILWNLEYCRRRMNKSGVVMSELDEFESRFRSGTNLHTSVLTYEALRFTAVLARALKHPETEVAGFEQQAATLRRNIESYFGATCEGFATYRYCDNSPNLRAFTCSPLFAGITERKQGTIAAILSPRMWRPKGLVVGSERNDVWEKSTLYALRGFFVVDEPDLAMSKLRPYCDSHLLGEHVPYAVESLDEGSKEHLSGECTLFLRIFTEGLFGIRPTGLRSFTCKPAMPGAWDRMALRRIHAFGGDHDLTVERSGKQLVTTLSRNGVTITRRSVPGEAVAFDLATACP